MGNNYYDKRGLYSDEILVSSYLKYGSQIKAAEHLDVSRETIARAVRRAGIKMNGRRLNGKGHSDRKQSQEKISDEELREAAQTLTCREIALKYNMSDERVFRRARALGIALDTKGTGGKWRTRAKRYGCTEFDKTISLKAVVTKYGGVCQICGRPTDWEDIAGGHIGRAYPTVDHIVPLSKGGAHTWENVQLAHMSCNAGKCDRMGSR